MTDEITLEPLKDPRGLVQHDLLHLQKIFTAPPVTPSTTLSQVMYEAGRKSVIDYIENKMVAKRA